MTQTLNITLVVNGQPYQSDVDPQEIYHEALEHAHPEGLLAAHGIGLSPPAGVKAFPGMFIGESVAHFKTHTFHVEAMPLRDVTAGSGENTWTNFGVDHLAITAA